MQFILVATRGVATGGGISVYIPPKSVYQIFMWLFCLLDPGQITFIPTQVKFLATTLVATCSSITIQLKRIRLFDIYTLKYNFIAPDKV